MEAMAQDADGQRRLARDKARIDAGAGERAIEEPARRGEEDTVAHEARDRAALRGLRRRPELNGKEVELVRWMPEAGKLLARVKHPIPADRTRWPRSDLSTRWPRLMVPPFWCCATFTAS